MYGRNPAVQALLRAVDDDVSESVLSIPKVIAALEVPALAKLKELMEAGSTHGIQLKAAAEILDRGTRASKIQRSVAVGVSIAGEDAKAIAKELVEARRVMQEYRGEVQGDWERVQTEASRDDRATP